MILNFKVKGFKVFNKEVELSFKANKKIKNKDYVFKINEEEVLKSAIIYGPNNTGKSALIESLELLKEIIKNGKIREDDTSILDFNFFNSEKEISYEIEFIENKIKFKYILSFQHKKGIKEEELYINDEKLFDRNEKNKEDELQGAIRLISAYHERLVISTLPPKYKAYADCINNFFDNITILKNRFDFDEVISSVLSLNTEDYNRFNNIMKSADVSINGFEINKSFGEKSKLKLFSEYIMNDVKFSAPSYLTDSDGTKVFMYYMIKIQKCMKNGGVLVIDEVDRSLHTSLTKSIISIFNDEKNNNSQLIATSHDLLLLDCLYLFRKDQIWFTYKDNKEVYLYSLNNFKSNIDNQIRNKTMESYLKGLFGALPHPNIEKYIYNE